MTKEQRKRISERMKKHNPMKDPESSKKARASYKVTISSEGYKHPNKGRDRPDARQRMLEDNPMRNPDIASKTKGPRPSISGSANPMKRFEVSSMFRGDNHPLRRSEDARRKHKKGCAHNGLHMKDNDTVVKVLKKGRQTLMANGGLSRGQQEMFGALSAAGFRFVPEHPIQVSDHTFFVDAFLPDYQLAVEYDGYYTHQTESHKDQERDRLLRTYAGIDTVRIVPSDLSICVHLVKERIGA